VKRRRGSAPTSASEFSMLSKKLFYKIMRKILRVRFNDSVPAERTKNDLLGLTHDGGEVFASCTEVSDLGPP
jgi:hypothetical protein